MSNEAIPWPPPLRRAAAMLAAVLLAGLAAPPAALGQIIDYGGLEALFGEPVTTSATGTPNRASQVPVAMEIVTAEDIRRSGATDIPGVLSHLAGIDVMHISPSQVEVGLRGYIEPLADSHLMVLINGRQIYSNLFGSVIWEVLPVQLEEIRQIEVVKGANSALYGFNAVSGVINIITYDPLYDDVGALRLRGGTDAYGEAAGIATARSGEAGLRLSAGGMHVHDPGPADWQPADNGARGNTQRRALSADAAVRASDTVQARLEANYAKDDGRHFFLLTPLKASIESAAAKLDLQADTAAGLTLASLYHNRMEGKSRADILTFPAEYREDTTVFNLSDLFKVGTGSTLRLIGELRHSATQTYADQSGRLTADIGSLGGVWTWHPTDRVSLLTAARGDVFRLGRSGGFMAGVPYANSRFDRLMVEPSVNQAASWRLTPLDTLRASVARGVQLPSLGAYGTMSQVNNGEGLPMLSYGNPGLEPSHVVDYELSYDRTLPSLDASGRLTLFHQDMDNLRGFVLPVPDAQGIPASVVQTLGSSRSYGLETSLKGRLGGPWQWDVTLTVQRIFDSLIPDSAGKDFAHGVPPVRVNAHLGYAEGAWEADLWAGYSSSLSLPGDQPPGSGTLGRVKPGTVLSPRVGYRLTPAVMLELEANALWRVRDNPIGVNDQRVLASVLVRY